MAGSRGLGLRRLVLLLLLRGASLSTAGFPEWPEANSSRLPPSGVAEKPVIYIVRSS